MPSVTMSYHKSASLSCGIALPLP
eukprot:COSAG02_NODE_24283_length_693_cov_0.530303_1_plen_23_part_10